MEDHIFFVHIADAVGSGLLPDQLQGDIAIAVDKISVIFRIDGLVA